MTDPGAPKAPASPSEVPTDRRRFADLLRVASIALVVLGHWLVAVILIREGSLVTGQLLQLVPRTTPLTWLFQVMPVFFFVGGFANLGSWERARAQGGVWATWVRQRARRLLAPLLPLLALWVPLAVVLGAVGVPEALVVTVAETALIPVWFLVVYVGIIAIVPITAGLHRRCGAWVIGGALILIAVVDLLHRRHVPGVGFANYLLVWGLLHQLGYFWHDRQVRIAWARRLAVAALGWLSAGLLIRFAGYPLSMVAVSGLERQNTSPPSLALTAFGIGQIALLLAAETPVERWLQHPRRFALVARAGSVALTVFLWHMTALIAVAAVLHPVGFWPQFRRIDGTWWALRPVWMVVCALALAGLVVLFRRFETAPVLIPHRGHWRVLLGLGAVLGGLAMVMVDGVYQPQRTWKVPVGAIGLLLLGMGSLGLLTAPADSAPKRPGTQ